MTVRTPRRGTEFVYQATVTTDFKKSERRVGARFEIDYFPPYHCRSLTGGQTCTYPIGRIYTLGREQFVSRLPDWELKYQGWIYDNGPIRDHIVEIYPSITENPIKYKGNELLASGKMSYFDVS